MHATKRNMTVIEAYRYFGTKPKNPNWSWSGRADDDRSVTVTVWQHELVMVKGRLTVFGSVDDPRLGALHMKKDLQFALERCGGRVNVVIAVAIDPRAKQPKVRRRFPASFKMLVKGLDLKTGRYRLEIERDDILAA